jgi:derlin-1
MLFTIESSFSYLDSRYKYFPNRRGGVGGFGQAPTRRPDNNNDRPAPRVHGRGYRLGD